MLVSSASAQEVDMIYRMNRWTYDLQGRGQATDISADARDIVKWEFTKAGFEPPNEIRTYAEGRLLVPLLIFEYDIYLGERAVYWVRAAMSRQTIPQQYVFLSMAARGYGHAADQDSLLAAGVTSLLEYLGVYSDKRFAIIGGLNHRSGRIQARFPQGHTIEWVNEMGETVATDMNPLKSGSTVHLTSGVYFVFATNVETGNRLSYTIVVR